MLTPMLAVLERPDMPRSVLGITGLNLYNVALVAIMIGFMADQTRVKKLNMPRHLVVLAWSYLILVVIAGVRLYMNRSGVHILDDQLGRPYATNMTVLIENLIDPIRFVLPGFMLAYGMASKKRVTWLIYAVFAMGTLMGLQIISRMVPALLGDQNLGERALRVLQRGLGYQRVAASTVMALTVAAMFALMILGRNKLERWVGFGGFLFNSVALVATGGRAGILACGVACTVLMVLRKRKLLLIAPLFVLILVSIPGFENRMLQGIGSENTSTETYDSDVSLKEVTSGRTVVWPYVVKKIFDAPLIGYGSNAMVNTGLALEMMKLTGSKEVQWPHPHNAYLRVFLEEGVPGGLVIVVFYLLLSLSCVRSTLNRLDPDIALLGGATLSMLIAFAVASIGSGSFVPEERTSIMYSMVGAFLGYKYGGFARRSEAIEQPQLAPFRRGLWADARGGGSAAT